MVPESHVNGSIKEDILSSANPLLAPRVLKVKKERAAEKFLQAKAYIEKFKADCDSLPCVDKPGQTVWVVPFGSIIAFHSEYKRNMELRGDEACSLSTFTRAFCSFDGR